jgi:DNA gyrase/topoisomerase IV subunit B
VETTKTSPLQMYYKDGNQPVVVECNYNNGHESLAAEECEEFIEEIGNPGLSMGKRKALDHLKHTKYIISCQLLSDIDDDGYHLNGELLNIFVNNYGGLIQADGEGFYKGHKLIVELG